MFELYGCPTHYGVGAKGLIKSIDYLTENFKNSFTVILFFKSCQNLLFFPRYPFLRDKTLE